MNKNQNKIIIAVVAVQALVVAVLAVILLNFIFNPSGGLGKIINTAIVSYAGTLKTTTVIEGQPGASGQSIKGDDGAKGDKGDRGDRGETGAQGVAGNDGATGATGSPGVQGTQGETGMQGARGEQADFRCNETTFRRQYKYPSDEDWTTTNETCIPATGGMLNGK